MSKINKVPEIRFKGYTEAWEQRKLEDIADVSIGEFVIKSKQSDDAPYPVFNGGKECTGYYDEYNNEANKIVISARGANAGFVNIVEKKFWAGNSCYSISIKDEKLYHLYFLYQFIKYRESLFTEFQQAANIPAVSKKDVLFFSVEHPLFEEQNEIGNFYRDLDSLITLHQHKYNQVVNLKKAMLEKMFPKNGSRIPEIRFKGYTGPWEQRKFGDIGHVAMCKRIFKEETSESGDVPFYKIGTFGGEADAYITREMFEKYKTMYPYPQKGDILISASGSIGRTVEYTGKDEYFQDSNIVWLQHNKNIDNSFLKVLYSVVQWSCEGSTIKRLYNDNFLKTKILIPNKKEQSQIGEYFKNLDNLIALHQRKLQQLKHIKKAILEKMFV